MDTEKLRELAAAATPGPWVKGPGGLIEKADEPFVEVAHSHSHANRDYIAAANPAAITALLDDLDNKSSAVTRLYADLRAAERRVAALTDALAAAEAKVSGLEEGLRALADAYAADWGQDVEHEPEYRQARALLASGSDEPEVASSQEVATSEHPLTREVRDAVTAALPASDEAAAEVER